MAAHAYGRSATSGAIADSHYRMVAAFRRRRRRGKRWRMVGIFQHGWSLIIAALINHQLLPVKPGRPEAWPRLLEIDEILLANCAMESGG